MSAHLPKLATLKSVLLKDTIKTRAQIAPRGQFKGPMDIAMQTIRKEGFLALYKGEPIHANTDNVPS